MNGYEQQNEHDHKCAGCTRLETRLREIESKISQWEDRAGFLRTIIVAAVMTIGVLVSALEWARTHLALK